jgi:hypothetical protein
MKLRAQSLAKNPRNGLREMTRDDSIVLKRVIQELFSDATRMSEIKDFIENPYKRLRIPKFFLIRI